MTVAANDVTPGPDQAATDWLLAMHRGFTPEEAEDFAAWLFQDPAHADSWERAKALWAAFDGEPDPILATIRTRALRFRRHLWRSPAARLTAVAASALLAVAAWQTLEHRPAGPPTTAVAAQRFIAGESRRVVQLADGSTVTLDARSALTVRETPSRRDVALLFGQAYFKVAHDRARPFVVTAGGRDVTATGTAFSVATDGATISVVLEEGHVLIGPGTPKRAAVELAPGQRFQSERGEAGDVSPVDPKAALAWRHGYVDLQDTPIADAVAQMNRYARTPIVIGDDKAGALRISGRFRIDDPQGFARSLAEIYPVRIVQRASGQLEIRSR